MKALTLHSEWSIAFMLMGKRYENRSWAPSSDLIGENIALHASATFPGKRSKRWRCFTETANDAGSRCSHSPDGLVTVDGAFAWDTDYQVRCGEVFAVATLVGIKTVGRRSIVSGRDLYEGRIKGFQGSWEFGPYCWIFDNIRMVTGCPPVKGKQRLWNWEPPAALGLS